MHSVAVKMMKLYGKIADTSNEEIASQIDRKSLGNLQRVPQDWRNVKPKNLPVEES